MVKVGKIIHLFQVRNLENGALFRKNGHYACEPAGLFSFSHALIEVLKIYKLKRIIYRVPGSCTKRGI